MPKCIKMFDQSNTTGYMEANKLRPQSSDHYFIDSAVTSTDVAGKTVRINSIINTGKTVRINSIINTGTANSFIGFQSKPRQGAAMANNVIGCEVSAQISDTFALTSSGSLIGGHFDVFLRGTTGNIGGDVRALQIELVTDDAATRTVTGNVNGIRMRAAFSGTISGKMAAIRIEKAEAQTNSRQWDYVMDLTDVNGLIWDDDWGTEPSTAAGGFKVRINGQDRWVQCYSSAPVS